MLRVGLVTFFDIYVQCTQLNIPRARGELEAIGYINRDSVGSHPNAPRKKRQRTLFDTSKRKDPRILQEEPSLLGKESGETR